MEGSVHCCASVLLHPVLLRPVGGGHSSGVSLALQVCKTQFTATQHVPLETAAGAPKAIVDPAMYIPPALRYGSAGASSSQSTPHAT